MSVSSHPSWSLPIQQGTLLLTPCPGTQGIELCESLSQLKAGGATAIITLMTAAELSEEGFQDFSSAVKAAGLDWFHLPVPDDDLPGADFDLAWNACSAALLQRLQSGDTLALHCKGGSGRTGLVAAKLMLAAGCPPEAAITAIQALRPKAFSHPAQRSYVLNSVTP
ncbi:protein-tyrosine phosphatase [Oceanisphaera litoralis]|uniref:phosphatase domain-containing protein n=1 Tax=Oceanisphaera litoralis TaxID=225144 RepID=UPI00195A30AE|nr:tyrosine-protein phosphatase [Oceanisphaera litoralis]MBM7457233.1 protein-tyrosine phosphatase [Oceanisphaera litoralis]